MEIFNQDSANIPADYEERQRVSAAVKRAARPMPEPPNADELRQQPVNYDDDDVAVEMSDDENEEDEEDEDVADMEFVQNTDDESDPGSKPGPEIESAEEDNDAQLPSWFRAVYTWQVKKAQNPGKTKRGPKKNVKDQYAVPLKRLRDILKTMRTDDTVKMPRPLTQFISKVTGAQQVLNDLDFVPTAGVRCIFNTEHQATARVTTVPRGKRGKRTGHPICAECRPVAEALCTLMLYDDLMQRRCAHAGDAAGTDAHCAREYAVWQWVQRQVCAYFSISIS